MSDTGRDPRNDPREGDVLKMNWGAIATIVRRTPDTVLVKYSDRPNPVRYGVPFLWSSEIAVWSTVMELGKNQA